MSLDNVTAAQVSAELARAGVTGDRVGILAALLALQEDFSGAEASEDDVRLILLTQARQLGTVAEKLAEVLGVDLDEVFAYIGEIELPE